MVLCALALFAPLSTGCKHASTDAPASPEAADAGKAADKAAPEADKGDAKDAGDKAGGDDAAPTVSVATATTGTAEKTLNLTGVLAVPRDAEATLSVPAPGVIEAFPVRLGARVAKGDVVLRLSARGLAGQIASAKALIAQDEIAVQQAQVAALQQQGQTRSGVLQAQSSASGAAANLLAAQATLTGDQAALEGARQTQQREEKLFAEGLVAQKDVDAARLAVQAADAAVQSQQQTIAGLAQAAQGQRQAVGAAESARLLDTVKAKDVEIARQQLANARGALVTLQAQTALYTLRAPLSGVVTAVNAANGEAVDTTTKVVTITDIDRLTLQIAVPTAATGAVRVGQSLRFKVDALPGQSFPAVVRQVLPQVDPASATITAVAEVDNRRHLLKDDLSAKVELVTATHAGAILLPKAALLIDNGASGAASEGASASVLKVGKDGAVHKTPVTVGWTFADMVEITSGVKAGDRVATTGAYGLDDGTKVKIAGADDADDKADAKGAKADDKGSKADARDADDKGGKG